MDIMCTLFSVTIGSTLPICAKMISFWVRKVQVLQWHICLLVLIKLLQCPQLLWLVFFVVSILQASDWVKGSSPARHYVST